MANVQKTLALILGIILAILGIWGFFIDSILGFGVNPAQSVLHLIGGAFGIYSGTKGMGKGFNISIGWIGIVLGILGFIPTIDGLLSDYLNINQAITWLHLILGVVFVIIGYTVKE